MCFVSWTNTHTHWHDDLPIGKVRLTSKRRINVNDCLTYDYWVTFMTRRHFTHPALILSKSFNLNFPRMTLTGWGMHFQNKCSLSSSHLLYTHKQKGTQFAGSQFRHTVSGSRSTKRQASLFLAFGAHALRPFAASALLSWFFRSFCHIGTQISKKRRTKKGWKRVYVLCFGWHRNARVCGQSLNNTIKTRNQGLTFQYPCLSWSHFLISCTFGPMCYTLAPNVRVDGQNFGSQTKSENDQDSKSRTPTNPPLPLFVHAQKVKGKPSLVSLGIMRVENHFKLYFLSIS